MKTGDLIVITDQFLAKYLKGKGLSPVGKLLKIDGGYHYIRPINAAANCIFELYSNEIGELSL